MLVTKTAYATRLVEGGVEFILSDETVDRYGDIIEANGWELANFKKNPIALFSHFPFEPIGTWENVRVVGKQLVGVLKTAARGTSARIDEIISLLEQGVLKAVSVGFRSLKSEPFGDRGGIRFKKQELLEASVVSIPANPSALQIAKNLRISEETRRLVFDEPVGNDPSLRIRGKPAAHTSKIRKDKPMLTLSKRIEDTQARLVATQDELQKHLADLPDEPSQEDNETTAELNEKIAELQETHGNLVEAEKRLAGSIERNLESGRERNPREDGRPFAVPAKKIEPLDYVFRALTVKLVSHVNKQSEVDTLKQLYGEDVTTKHVADIVLRAAVAPADTATPAWAGALVQTAIGDFFELLLPQSVYPRLSAIGGRFSFGRNGTVSLPTRDATPTVAGSFVGEGAPIPVRKAGFSAVTLTPKKMAVITTMTREITERSTPAIEQLLRNAIQEDTAVAIDSVLLDANAATTIRPVGLRNGIASAAGTAGGGVAAVVADAKAMIGALSTATNGNIRNPAWLMNPLQKISLSLIEGAGGAFPFKAEAAAGNFLGYPIIDSATVPAGVVILIDAADFFSATGDDPRFDVSDQATLHMEDTTPLAIGTAGSPNTVAAPVRSMFQTDCLALRMILPMNWDMRRADMLVERTAVSW